MNPRVKMGGQDFCPDTLYEDGTPIAEIAHTENLVTRK
jgi:hypothetical protein